MTHLVNEVDEGASGKAVAWANAVIGFPAEQRPIDVVRPHIRRRQRTPARRAVFCVLAAAERLAAKRAEVPVDIAELGDKIWQHIRDEMHANAAHLRLLLSTDLLNSGDGARLQRRTLSRLPQRHGINDTHNNTRARAHTHNNTPHTQATNLVRNFGTHRRK